MVLLIYEIVTLFGIHIFQISCLFGDLKWLQINNRIMCCRMEIIIYTLVRKQKDCSLFFICHNSIA